MTGATIRPFTGDDVEEGGRICFESFDGVCRRHGVPPTFPSRDAGVARVRRVQGAASSFGLAAEIDGKLAGFAFMSERDAVRAIGPVAVDPQIQSRGVGRGLMTGLLERARGAPSVRLVQHAFNLQSMSLYASLGFDIKQPLVGFSGRPAAATAKAFEVRRMAPSDLAECDALHERLLGYSRRNELGDLLKEGLPVVALDRGRVAGYLAAPTRGLENHAVAESEEAMQALLAGAGEMEEAPLSFLLSARDTSLYRWCLAAGLRATLPNTLMSIGDYVAPAGIYFPSILY
jgi:predicted N-acetyltransferase YhbS